MAEKIRSREEIAREDTWAIEDLYASNEAWIQDLEKLKTLGAKLPEYAGKLSASAQTLLEYQKLGEEISVLLDSLANYAQRKSDEDTRNAVYQDLTGKLTKVWVQLGADTAFEVPELLSISDEQMEKFYEEVPELNLYRRHFDSIRRKRAHVLSESEEKLLAMAGEMAGTPEEVYALFADADLTFRPALDANGEEHPITQGSYIAAMESPTGRSARMRLRAYMPASARIKTRWPPCSPGRSSSSSSSQRRGTTLPLWKRLWTQRRFLSAYTMS